MKHLVIAIAFLLAGCSASTTERLNDIMDRAVVQIGNYCSGSVISIKEKLILTANHCLQDSDRADISLVQITQRRWDSEHKEYMGLDTWARVIAFDEKHDIAILQLVAGTPDGELSMSIEEMHRGKEVYTVGNPLGFPMFLGKGIITSANFFFSDMWTIAHSATMAPGNSGGALLNADGQLIALTNWSLSMYYGQFSIPTGHYIALPIEYVIKFLDEKQIKI